jgi:alkylhydroperoxidase family enzyme
VPRARQAGVPQRQLDLLPAWREAGVKEFSEQHRAALDLAEALTVLDEGADLDGLAEAASAHLTRAQIAAVQWTTTLINAFNRISIASGHPALTVKE